VGKINNNGGSILGYKYEDLVHNVSDIAINLVLSVIIIIVGFWLTKRLGNFVRKVLVKSKTDESLVSFVSNLTVISCKILVVLSAMSQLGIAMTSFVTILGAAGIAIGLAFSGTLSNIAGGIMILVLKPFKINDVIVSQTIQGRVTDILIFNTYILTDDNKVIILPNGPLVNGNIVNFTKENKRKIVLLVPISYGEDIELIRKEISKLLVDNVKILKDTEPLIQLAAINETNASISISIWVKSSEFAKLSLTLNELIYNLINKEGRLIVPVINCENESN
jgi:small conductance mechanosensitive channel